MGSVIVYRVEGPDGLGPYRSTYTNDRLHTGAHLWQVGGEHCHPTPEDDGLERLYENERCGFSDMEQVMEWFSKEGLAFLASNKFFLYGYTVPESAVKYGRNQVVFDPALAVQRVRVL